VSVQLRTLSGDHTDLPDETIEELRMLFQGPVVTPDDADYDEVRIVQNGMIDRRPGLIVRCSGIGDVIDAVDLAVKGDLLIAIRAGGHGIAGHCTFDDALMIDLSPMRGVWVDPAARRVRVQGGATWGDVDRETQVFGLAVPGGVVSTTGVAGLTLGGGIGWLHRKWGLACDALRAVEIVTADGQLLRASESDNPDLFWALRGGGGNFGVATAFEFECYPLGPIVMNGACMYAAEDADRVLPAWRDWTAGLPDEITSRAVFWSMPEAPALPPAVHNRDVLITGAVYAGAVEDGEKAVEPVRHFGTPLADLTAPMPYRVVQSLFDPFFPKGELHSYWKSTFLREMPDDALDLVLQAGNGRPNPLTMVHVPTMGGAVDHVGPGDTAFGDRSANYMLSVDGNWHESADDERITSWVRQVIDDAERLPSATGTYLNFCGDLDVEADQRTAAFGGNLERLARVKKEYDPENRFRLNANIPPAD
jgi:FAD/FMN-containing dehydrogenase